MITTDNQDSMLMLTYSMRKVSVAEQYYKMKTEMLQVAVAREIFQELIDDEMQHRELIRGLLEQIESGTSKPDLENYRTMEPKKRIESLFDGHKNDMPPSPDDKADAINALKFALIMEQKSFNIFSESACDICDNDAAEVYIFLAEEENKHYNMIKNAMVYVENPMIWFYNAEDLVYRQG